MNRYKCKGCGSPSVSVAKPCSNCGGSWELVSQDEPRGTTFKVTGMEPFVQWYEGVAELDAAMIWDKAEAYGGFDIQAGYIALLAGRGGLSDKDDPLDHERALAFNACQKLARIAESLARGQAPSEDSWRDLCCYAMIARRLRVTKLWPA